MADPALGARPPCPRCGTPGGPTGHGYTTAGYTCPPPDVVAALREGLARVTAEREGLARVTAERDAAVADLDIERDSRDINRSLDAAAAVRAMYRVNDACDALRAAVAAPVDTGWRDRAPMEAEVRAHRKAHPDDGGAGLWMVQPPGRMLQVWALYSSFGDEPGRWRPITAEGDPAPWPKVTP